MPEYGRIPGEPAEYINLNMKLLSGTALTLKGLTPPARHRWATRLGCGVLAAALAVTPVTASETTDLPSLGGVGGGLISSQMETEIGEMVMTSIRRSARQVHDPLVEDYLADVVYRLVPFTPLDNRNLKLVVIDSPMLNAFAVPGGIIGVNGGLFLNAETEQQFGSVIAHELAHLSQRHFARRMEQQQANAPLTIAGVIAGIVLSAVTRSDIGIAAIAGTQAAAIQNMLQYSRAHEQEADRIGMEIMAKAGMDPRGMPEMFEIMMRQNRMQGGHLPEYLSTHPLTQSRVSDTRSRAAQYPVDEVSDALEYHLVRARLQVRYARSATQAADAFASYIKDAGSDAPPAAHYGLAVALKRQGDLTQAESVIKALLADYPGRISYLVTLANIHLLQDQAQEARALMEQALARNPRNYPISVTLAEAELKLGNGPRAAEQYRLLTRRFPERAELWSRLAEAEGLARDIVGVHRARAEYELLMGNPDAAVRQLREAQEKAQPGTPVRQVVTERLSQISANLPASLR